MTGAPYAAGFVAFQRALAADLNADFAFGVPIIIDKQADEVIISSTAYQDDDELAVTLPANWVGFGWLHLVYASGTTGDLKYKMVGTATTVFRQWSCLQYDTGIGLRYAVPGDTQSIGGNGPTNPLPADMMGVIDVGATGGIVKVQWAQNASQAVNTTVFAGSTLMLMRSR